MSRGGDGGGGGGGYGTCITCHMISLFYRCLVWDHKTLVKASILSIYRSDQLNILQLYEFIVP